MTFKRVLVPAGFLAVVLAASVAVPELRGLARSPEDDVPTYVVERGEFVRRVHADGNLEASDATILGPPAEIRRRLKIAWLARDGAFVRAGDVVIRFDPTELEEELREGRHDAATTDTQISSKKVREEGSNRNLARDADIASLELDYAKTMQAKDEQIFSRTQIIEDEIDQELAERRKDHAAQSGEVHQELARAELDLLAIERRKAELKITQAQEALQGLELRAPHDGIFVLKKSWWGAPEVGQEVWSGNAVAEIPKPEKMKAEVYVLEADAGGLEVGLDATVVLEAHPDKVYRAKVSHVSALAQRRNNRVPIQYFNVSLELEQTDPAVMKPGQRVRSVLVLDQRDDVLTVPRQAIFEREGKKIVYVNRSGRFEPTEVELGPTALGRVVIDRGLNEGERVALRDPTRPADEPEEEDHESGSSPVS